MAAFKLWYPRFKTGYPQLIDLDDHWDACYMDPAGEEIGMDAEEWSEWFTHDGSPCPCVGKWVMVETNLPNSAATFPLGAVIWNNKCFEYMPMNPQSFAWMWTGKYRVLRYRIKTPKALLRMRELIQFLDIRQTEDA